MAGDDFRSRRRVTKVGCVEFGQVHGGGRLE
jgi:hypothetical protein